MSLQTSAKWLTPRMSNSRLVGGAMVSSISYWRSLQAKIGHQRGGRSDEAMRDRPLGALMRYVHSEAVPVHDLERVRVRVRVRTRSALSLQLDESRDTALGEQPPSDVQSDLVG